MQLYIQIKGVCQPDKCLIRGALENGDQRYLLHELAVRQVINEILNASTSAYSALDYVELIIKTATSEWAQWRVKARRVYDPLPSRPILTMDIEVLTGGWPEMTDPWG